MRCPKPPRSQHVREKVNEFSRSVSDSSASVPFEWTANSGRISRSTGRAHFPEADFWPASLNVCRGA